MKETNNPIGLITKTDILKAYHDNLTLDDFAEEIMSRVLEACEEHMSRDQAARVMERNKNHHAIVMNKNAEFIGLVSSWDITVECARDDRAWPWNRPEDGKFHSKDEKQQQEQEPQEMIMGTSPTTPVDEAHISNVRAGGAQRKSQLGDSFRDYIDHLGLVDM
ncbi:MAG: hypothetical protein SGARI_000252 [Bacillariaceae sp.]